MHTLQQGQGELIGWRDPDEHRAWVATNKSRALKDKRMTLREAIARYALDGSILACGGFGHSAGSETLDRPGRGQRLGDRVVTESVGLGVGVAEVALDVDQRQNLLRDVYVVLGDKQTEGDAWAVRAYVKPLAVWIWLGALIMGVGGMVSLSDRRYRVGAAAKARPAAPALPAE